MMASTDKLVDFNNFVARRIQAEIWSTVSLSMRDNINIGRRYLSSFICFEFIIRIPIHLQVLVRGDHQSGVCHIRVW
eukprot:g19150.t1